MDEFTFGVMLLAMFLAGLEIGVSYRYVKYRSLIKENRRLKQMLDDMQRIEELSYRACCAMFQEAAHAQQQLTWSTKNYSQAQRSRRCQ